MGGGGELLELSEGEGRQSLVLVGVKWAGEVFAQFSREFKLPLLAAERFTLLAALLVALLVAFGDLFLDPRD